MAASRDTTSTAWWKADEGKAHTPLGVLLKQLQGYERDRRTDITHHLALYGDRSALKRAAGGRVLSRLSADGSRLTLNLTKSVVDAAQSTIAAQHTRPRVLTSDGDWSLQRKAKLMELALEAEYDRCDVWRQAHQGFLDAAKVGTTAFKVYSEAGRPVVDLVRPGELLVDPADGRYGDPRRIYQVCPVDREVLLAQYGSDKSLANHIRRAPSMDQRDWFPWVDDDTSLDLVMVLEAWQEPDPDTWEDAQPGRHVIALDNVTLLDEEWDRCLPFAIWHYDRDTVGFWGRGIVENLRSLQRELNKTLIKIQHILHLNAGFRVLVEKTAAGPSINVERLTNSPGEVLEYEGNPPVIHSVNQVPGELFRHVEWLVESGYQQEGVSRMGAQSRKPSGLNSGAALREFNDVESRRFETKSKSFERFIGVDLAKLVIEEKRWIAQQEGDEQGVRVQQRRGRGVTFRTVKWSEVDIQEEDYQLRFYPASALPSTPAGRIATVEAWIGAGLIDRDQALKLLDFPDLEDFTRSQLSAHEIILDALETMVEDATYVPPEPVQDLQLTMKLASEAYQRYRISNVPEERTELVLRYIDDARALMEQAQAPAPATAPAGPPAPEMGMPPGAPPVMQ